VRKTEKLGGGPGIDGSMKGSLEAFENKGGASAALGERGFGGGER